MFIAELTLPDFNQYNLSSLRTGVIAGAPCPMELMKQLIEKMNLREITIGYGFTESSPLLTQTRYNVPLEVKVGTVGKSHQNVKIKIIDPETKKDLPPNTPGEVCGYGYNAMKGYYNMPERTKEVIDKDGWMHTGDLGTMDEAGVVKIVGRIKDMIIRGGENIYPAEVEEFFMTNEKIEMVQVVGVPDQKFGEQMAAAIKLKTGEQWSEEEAKEWCKGKIANYKIPHYIKFVNEFPMTANGKIQKYKLRESLQKTLV
jgi:acyl-CoA synthetase (AMP-forming)/AMP-acid ligase II